MPLVPLVSLATPAYNLYRIVLTGSNPQSQPGVLKEMMSHPPTKRIGKIRSSQSSLLDMDFAYHALALNISLTEQSMWLKYAAGALMTQFGVQQSRERGYSVSHLAGECQVLGANETSTIWADVGGLARPAYLLELSSRTQ